MIWQWRGINKRLVATWAPVVVRWRTSSIQRIGLIEHWPCMNYKRALITLAPKPFEWRYNRKRCFCWDEATYDHHCKYLVESKMIQTCWDKRIGGGVRVLAPSISRTSPIDLVEIYHLTVIPTVSTTIQGPGLSWILQWVVSCFHPLWNHAPYSNRLWAQSTSCSRSDLQLFVPKWIFFMEVPKISQSTWDLIPKDIIPKGKDNPSTFTVCDCDSIQCLSPPKCNNSSRGQENNPK